MEGADSAHQIRLVLTGEGIASMTEETLRGIGEIAASFGLTLRVEANVDPEPLPDDPLRTADELSAVGALSLRLASMEPESLTAAEQAGITVLRSYWWQTVHAKATAVPTHMTYVADHLAASTNPYDRTLAGRVLVEVLTSHVIRSELGPAAAIADRMIRLSEGPWRSVRVELTQTLEPVIYELEALVAGGRAELRMVLDRVRQAEGGIIPPST